MAWISPRSVIKYFSGEEGSLSEICFEGSDDDLGMGDEDPYDPMGPLYQSDDEDIHHNIKISLWVIQSHFNKNFHMTVSELDETLYASSTFSFVMPDKISLSFIVWLPG